MDGAGAVADLNGDGGPRRQVHGPSEGVASLLGEALESSGARLSTGDGGHEVGTGTTRPGQGNRLTGDHGRRGSDRDLREGSREEGEESEGGCDKHIDNG